MSHSRKKVSRRTTCERRWRSRTTRCGRPLRREERSTRNSASRWKNRGKTCKKNGNALAVSSARQMRERVQARRQQERGREVREGRRTGERRCPKEAAEIERERAELEKARGEVRTLEQQLRRRTGGLWSCNGARCSEMVPVGAGMFPSAEWRLVERPEDQPSPRGASPRSPRAASPPADAASPRRALPPGARQPGSSSQAASRRAPRIRRSAWRRGAAARPREQARARAQGARRTERRKEVSRVQRLELTLVLGLARSGTPAIL